MDQDDCQLVETDSGYYVISFHGRYLCARSTSPALRALSKSHSSNSGTKSFCATRLYRPPLVLERPYVISFHGRYLVDEPTRDVRHILIQAESTTGEGNKLVAPTDEAWAAAKAKMDESI